MPRKAKYQWVVLFKDGKRKDVAVATGYREAAYFAAVETNHRMSDLAEVQRHVTGDTGWIYRSWRFR